ncbi:helix-turn-helix transcriptional regulator [Sphingomonas sp. PAMC 26617]|uniref:helix-turn-helix transcriptional regulator n=1 Tax=Sphingomonas sp. PAMC 26617 TaxID=1112216 RepID=UPI000288B21A|nr:AlpA family phage regulatory protein [Sphingomonas sp. PAMC 26617]
MTDAIATSPIQKDRRRDCLLRFPEVRRRTSLASSTVYRRMAEGTFPQCQKLSIRAVYWYESDIDDFIADPLGYRA